MKASAILGGLADRLGAGPGEFAGGVDGAADFMDRLHEVVPKVWSGDSQRYTRFDQMTAKILMAKRASRDTCPVCGCDGFLGDGDAVALATGTREPIWRNVMELCFRGSTPVGAGGRESGHDAGAPDGGTDQ